MDPRSQTTSGPPRPSRAEARARQLDGAWVAAHFAEAEVAPFSTADMLAVSRHVQPRSLDAGEVIFTEGEKPEGVWILQDGAIELTFGTGSERLLVRILYGGEAVGDIQILRDAPSRIKARAAESSECLFIDRDSFLSLVTTHPAVARRWMAKLALQVTKNHNRILSLLTGSLRGRVARFLQLESVGGVFGQSQGTIAAMLGIHRSSVNQILRDFESSGVITIAYRCIEVVDLEKLTDIAEGEHSGVAEPVTG